MYHSTRRIRLIIAPIVNSSSQGIFERKKEWSAAIVRAATATEIAANIAVRKRFEEESQFSAEFVDSLLVWANGVDGKLKRLIIPAERDDNRRRALNALKSSVEALNKKRNAIVHRGVFSDREETIEVVKSARKIVLKLMEPWEPTLKLATTSKLVSKRSATSSRK